MQVLFVLFGFAVVAGIGALLLRSLVLTIAFAVALALMALQWSSAHEHAQATVAVGVHAQDAQNAQKTTLEPSDIDGMFLSQLADETLHGKSRRFDIAANGSNAADVTSSVSRATRRVEFYLSERVPSSSAADTQVTKARAALVAANVQHDDTEAAWRAAKNGNPTALRKQAESELQRLERQQQSSDPATAQAAARAIPAVQQRVFDYSAAETRLGELTAARDTAGRAVDNATRALNDAEQTVKVADAGDQLIRVGPVRARSVDNAAELRAAFVFALIVCALAFGLALFLRWRADRAAPQFAGARAGGVTFTPMPRAPEPRFEPGPESIPEPEPIVVEAPRPTLVLRSEPIGDLEPIVFTPAPRFEPQRFTHPAEPEPQPAPEPTQEPVATPAPAAPAESEPEPFTVVLYRAPGAKAGEGPALTFEVRELAPASSVPGVDLAGAERAERSAPESIDLTDGVTDGAEKDESTRLPEQ